MMTELPCLQRVAPTARPNSTTVEALAGYGQTPVFGRSVQNRAQISLRERSNCKASR